MGTNLGIEEKRFYKNRLFHRAKDLPAKIYRNGTKEWWCHGKPHRENDLPAFEYSCGQKEWWWHGKPHRDGDKPALERWEGRLSGLIQEWWYNGKRHRENDLPAVQWGSGFKQYYKNGIEYCFIVQNNGTKEYYNHNWMLHKFDSPAIEYANGDVEYWEDGLRHRTDGPAVVIGDKQYWFENGEFQKCIFA